MVSLTVDDVAHSKGSKHFHHVTLQALLTAADTGCAAEALAVVAVVSSDAVFVNPV